MFKLKENGTKVSTEIIAGLTTFFAMAYIIFVNPSILSGTGMEWGAVFLATIFPPPSERWCSLLSQTYRTRRLPAWGLTPSS